MKLYKLHFTGVFMKGLVIVFALVFMFISGFIFVLGGSFVSAVDADVLKISCGDGVCQNWEIENGEILCSEDCLGEEKICDGHFEGYVYNEELNECELEDTAGCENPYEYKTLEECEDNKVLKKFEFGGVSYSSIFIFILAVVFIFLGMKIARWIMWGLALIAIGIAFVILFL